MKLCGDAEQSPGSKPTITHKTFDFLRSFVRQLVHTMFLSNNRQSFPLW